MNLRNEEGLTLIEILLAVVLIGIIITPIANFNLAIWNNFADRETQVAIQQQARDIIYNLERNIMRARRLEIRDIEGDGRPELLLEFSADLIADPNYRFIMYDFRHDGCFTRAIKAADHEGTDWTVADFWGKRSPVTEPIVFPDETRPFFDSNEEGSLIYINFVLKDGNFDYPVFYELHPRLAVVVDNFE